MCLDTLLDTGSPISFVKECFVDKQAIVPLDTSDREYFGCKGVMLDFVGKIYATVTIDNDVRERLRMYVAPETTTLTPALIGRDILRKFGFQLIVPVADVVKHEIVNVHVIENKDSLADDLQINPMVPYDAKKKLRQRFREFYANVSKPIEPKTKSELKLRLTQTEPFHSTPRKLSYDRQQKLRIILDGLLQKGYVRDSDSEFASPIVLTEKRNGKLRLCVDYRALNKVTARDNYPMPLIEDQLTIAANKKYFTLLDLKDGFHHVRMAEDSIKYTSFVTPLGQYEWLRMSFGLHTAPAAFQRYINLALTEFIRTGDMAIYMDDILVATETLEHHLEVLKRVFKTLSENHLELRIDKCYFLQTEIEYLGYVISGQGVRPTRRGVEAIEKFSIPKNVRDVRGFIGLCSYFRKFIEHFAAITKPLYDLTKANMTFKFGKLEYEAFMTLKSRLTEAPILAIYNPNDLTELHCDASSAGYGAILMQRKSDGKMHPVFYFSRRTTDKEAKLHSFELETLAIIYALERFRIYLQGLKFKILTDCSAVTMTLKKRDVNRRVERWAIALLDFDYELEYRAGTRMRHIDALSRTICVVEENPLEWNVTVC